MDVLNHFKQEHYFNHFLPTAVTSLVFTNVSIVNNDILRSLLANNTSCTIWKNNSSKNPDEREKTVHDK